MEKAGERRSGEGRLSTGFNGSSGGGGEIVEVSLEGLLMKGEVVAHGRREGKERWQQW